MGKPAMDSDSDSESSVAKHGGALMMDDDEDQTPLSLGPTSEEMELGWPEFIGTIVFPAISGSATRKRVEVLQAFSKKIMSDDDHLDSYLPSVIQNLLFTIPRYLDSASRKAVLSVLRSIVQKSNASTEVHNTPLLKGTTKLLERELKGNTGTWAPAVLYNYTAWTAQLLKFLLKTPASKDKKGPNALPANVLDSYVWKSLISLHANLLDSIAVSQGTHYRKFLANAVVRTQRVLSSGGEAAVDAILQTLLTVPASEGKDGLRGTILIGICMEYATNRNFDTVRKSFDPKLITYFTKAILPSRTEIPVAYIDSLSSFIAHTFTEDVFTKEISSVAERLVLRSPEVVLRVLDQTVRHVQFDMSTLFRQKYAEMLFTQLKSTNEDVRRDAAAFFATLCSKSSKAPEMVKVFEMAQKAIVAKGPSAENRQSFYVAISHIPTSPVVAKSVVATAPLLTAKETNEASLAALAQALVPHVTEFLASKEFESKALSDLISFFISGISDVKSGVRRAILSLLVDASTEKTFATLLSTESATCQKLVDVIVKAIKNVQAAGVALVDPKKETPALVEAYLGMEWIQQALLWEQQNNSQLVTNAVSKADLMSSTLSSTAKNTSFLLNDKFYSKLLPTSEEQLRFATVVFNIVRYDMWYDVAAGSQATSQQLLANALSWGLIQAPFSTARRNLFERLSSVVASEDRKLTRRTVELVRLGVGQLYVDSGANARDPNGWIEKLSQSSDKFGQRVFGALCAVLPKGSDGESTVQSDETGKYLMDLAVLACHPSVEEIMGNDAWIRLCFRAGTGPHIVSDHGAEYVAKLIGTSPTQHVSEGGLDSTKLPEAIVCATLNALILFTEVETDAVTQTALPWAIKNLNSLEARQLSVTDVAIWATPEGTLYNDPTVKKGAGRVDDRPKTAEEKWERDLKNELQKKGKLAGAGSKNEKLSKADRELQQQQLEKENSIRKSVSDVRQTVFQALAVIDAVIQGVTRSVGDNARESFEEWVDPLVEAFVDGILARELFVYGPGRSGELGPVLAGRKAVDTFVQLGHALGHELEHIMHPPLLAITTLRLLGIKEDPELGVSNQFSKVSVAEAAGSVISNIQEHHTGAHSLSAAAFAYVFPLIRAIVLREGRVHTLKDRLITDLSIEVADILLAHCGLGSSPLVPRKMMLKCLLELLERYPRLRVAGREGLLMLAFSVAAGHDEDDDFERDSDELKNEKDTQDVVQELLNGLSSPEEAVREGCLAALTHLQIPPACARDFDARVWIARSDPVEKIRDQADALWELCNGEKSITESEVENITRLVAHKVEAVRTSAGRALCQALKVHPSLVNSTLDHLYSTFLTKAAVPEPEYDGFGMIIPESLTKPDEWEARAGVVYALEACVPVITELHAMETLFKFLVDKEALGDRDERVQRLALDAGLAAANAGGKEFVRQLLDVIHTYLSQPAKPSTAHDRIRESCVILLGTLARHLESTDPMIPEVIAKLIDTLKTPSETVQMAVSECLPALIKVNKAGAQSLVEKLLHQLYSAPKYGERRGAAYGLAGVVKGCGIAALKDFQIMSSLKEAVEDKKRSEKREGALFAFETLSMTLGRLFEPYVIQILPYLLVCYGDSNKQVREATEDTCRVIMSKLSAHCVKLVLPSLLNGLEDKNWRAKTGSIDVLASMAYLAPKQLSVSLPTVIPSLVDVLGDTHAKVHESAKQALNTFGGVIKNPEIQALVPMLIAALVDPNGKTLPALKALLDTSFVHYIDAPSLALLVPILHRGLKERSTDIKKRAAQIMGNMATLTDPKDLTPYLPTLMPGLKEVLVDPVPEARATSAKAFGNMVSKLGEGSFPGLIAELFDKLKADNSGVDRSGAAQGLAEIIAGLGIQRLEDLLPEIIANANSTRTYIREGFMTLLIYLPATYGEKFQPYLGSIIPLILRGLADESETVRDASMKVGQVIVRSYATTAIDLLLPELETGLFDESWRIRQSSIQLMGDLLYRIAGVSGKVDMDIPDDEGLGSEHGRQALINALGKDRFNRVLASLYVARGDNSAVVRQASMHVWKSIVANTPRTLKEIMPILMEILVGSLASENDEKRGCAARCLADLVRKLGDRILQDLLPILENGLESERVEIRQGVCVAMSEIMTSAGKAQIMEFVEQCVSPIKTALIDPEPSVREAAAAAFDMLHQHMGRQAIDEILPSLLNMLKSGATATSQTTFALEALKEIMAVRSSVVFPVLIPTLTTQPISAFNAHALAVLIKVAGPALNKRLDTLLPALMEAVEEENEADAEVRETIKVLLENVEGEEGVSQLSALLAEAVRDSSSARKRVGCESLKIFCDNTEETLETDDVEDWIELLIGMMRGGEEGENKDVVKSAWAALDAIVKRVNKEDLEGLVKTVRRAIMDAEEGLGENEYLEGFCLPKGVSPILTILLQGLMYGSADNREQSALGLGDIVRRTSPDALKPYVTQITGPLIRVIGDRFPSGVKGAILMSLALLLQNVPAMLKPFLPQLQRTFDKCLAEPGSGMVRDRAARCLSLLNDLRTRLDLAKKSAT
ncbi:armadillo-type protein [Phlyctochytrium arcticum]|nr:armadillo-type protein [Phlyctochytrium arcticum]